MVVGDGDALHVGRRDGCRRNFSRLEPRDVVADVHLECVDGVPALPNAKNRRRLDARRPLRVGQRSARRRDGSLARKQPNADEAVQVGARLPRIERQVQIERESERSTGNSGERVARHGCHLGAIRRRRVQTVKRAIDVASAVGVIPLRRAVKRRRKELSFVCPGSRANGYVTHRCGLARLERRHLEAHLTVRPLERRGFRSGVDKRRVLAVAQRVRERLLLTRRLQRRRRRRR